MQGNMQVRGRGRNAPVFTDGHEDQPHRGGTMPDRRARTKGRARLEAQREATLARLEAQILGISLSPQKKGDGVHAVISALTGNA